MMETIMFFMIGIIAGGVLGYFGHKLMLAKRTAYGTCTKFPDGEMYLKITEEGQRKLADPTTEMLYIMVYHPDWKRMPSPRNKQPF